MCLFLQCGGSAPTQVTVRWVPRQRSVCRDTATLPAARIAPQSLPPRSPQGCAPGGEKAERAPCGEARVCADSACWRGPGLRRAGCCAREGARACHALPAALRDHAAGAVNKAKPCPAAGTPRKLRTRGGERPRGASLSAPVKRPLSAETRVRLLRRLCTAVEENRLAASRTWRETRKRADALSREPPGFWRNFSVVVNQSESGQDPSVSHGDCGPHVR